MSYHLKQYCKDYQNIENYEKALADNFVGWECHHRLETHTPEGERRGEDISHKELIALGLYYNRPPEELIFLTESEHGAYQKGKLKSEETRKKMSSSWDYDKHFTEETKNKMRESHKGKHHSEEARRKMKGKNIWTKGTRWYNNGKINIRAKECPPGFVPGQLR